MSERLLVRQFGLTEGGAPTVVLLHGLTDSGRGWPDAVARWAGTYRLIAIDALGHGESDRWTDDDLASDDPIETMVTGTIDALETLDSHPVLYGHSMGAGVAAAIAARRPDLVRGAVLEEPTWRPNRSDRDAARGAMWIEETELARRDPEATLERVRSEVSHWSAAAQEAEAWGQGHVDPRFLALGRADLRQPWQEIASAITVPALVVTGTQDVIIRSDTIAEIRSLGNPHLELVIVDGAGHCVRRDRPEEFHTIVDPWLAARFA